jgi:hypothetical protein
MAEQNQNIKITFDSNAGEVTKNTNALGKSLGGVEDAAKQTNKASKDLNATFEQVYGDLQPLTTRMGEAEDRLYELALAGNTASQEYKDLLASVANYRKIQIQTDQVVDAAATTLGQKLGGAAQIAATAVQGATAGMALFGDQSEDTEKALLKVQAAMAFADAISSVSTLGGQFTILKASVLESSIVTKANSAAVGLAAIVQKLFTGSVNVTSTSFKVLKGAIAATGIGLLVVGVTALIQNFDTVKKVVLNLIPGLAGVSETIGNIVNAITDFVGVTSEADRAIDRIKANADQSIAINKKFLAEHGSQLNEFTKQKIDAKNKYNEAVKEDGADITALGRELNRELAAIEYSRGDEQRAIQKTNAEKAAADAITNAEKAAAAAITNAEKAAAAAVKAAEDAIKKRDELIAAAEAKAIADFQEEQNVAAELTAIDDEKQEAREEKTTQQGEDNLAQLKFFAAEEVAIEKAKEDQKTAVRNAQNTALDAGVSFLSRIAGKNKTLQKAAIIAESALGIGRSVIANSIANIGAKATPQAIATSGAAAVPVIAFNNITTGLGIAANVAATAKALQALGGGGGPSAGGNLGSGAGSGGGATPAVAFNNTSENQIGQSVARTQADQAPIQVFVSEKDITDAQTDVKVLVAKNTF